MSPLGVRQITIFAPDPYEQYVWDPGAPGYIDAPVVRFHDGDTNGTIDDTLYYTTDANMNVTALVDTSGTVLERVVYDPYGNPTFYDGSWTTPSATSSYDNVVLYCGYRWDGETGLYHVRHRMYHPTLGRWLQRDPIGYADGMGVYEYVEAQVTRATDPFGRELRQANFKDYFLKDVPGSHEGIQSPSGNTTRAQVAGLEQALQELKSKCYITLREEKHDGDWETRKAIMLALGDPSKLTHKLLRDGTLDVRDFLQQGQRLAPNTDHCRIVIFVGHNADAGVAPRAVSPLPGETGTGTNDGDGPTGPRKSGPVSKPLFGADTCFATQVHSGMVRLGYRVFNSPFRGMAPYTGNARARFARYYGALRSSMLQEAVRLIQKAGVEAKAMHERRDEWCCKQVTIHIIWGSQRFIEGARQ